MNEPSRHPIPPEAYAPAQELAVWLRSLQSFFDPANHPFTDAERASLSERSFRCETGVARDALLRCLHLLANVAHGGPPRGPAAETAGATAAAAPTAAPLGLVNAKESLGELSDVFKDVCRLCDALLESHAVGFAAWSSLGSLLERELRRSEAAGLILAAGSAGAEELQERLVALAQGLTPDDLGEDVLEIFRAFSRLLSRLRFVESSLKADAQLKRLLPVLTLVHEETRALLDFIEGRAMRVEGVERGASEILDGTAYAVRMEVRKAFEHELTGMCSVRQPQQVFAKVENAAGLLRDCYQQSVVALAQSFEPALDGGALFESFSTKLEQSLALRRELWNLVRLVRAASAEGERASAAPVLDALAAFGDGAQRHLMYKDWDALERFTEELESAHGARELSGTLHRFEAYVETLFGQVGMRAVLADHPFDPKQEQ